MEPIQYNEVRGGKGRQWTQTHGLMLLLRVGEGRKESENKVFLTLLVFKLPVCSFSSIVITGSPLYWAKCTSQNAALQMEAGVPPIPAIDQPPEHPGLFLGLVLEYRVCRALPGPVQPQPGWRPRPSSLTLGKD